MNSIESLKEDVASTMRRLYDRFLTTATGGNVSARIDDLMLITPTALDKGNVRACDIAVIDIKTGENLTPEKKLSIESEMHRSCYLKRDDIKAVVHSHPLFSSLFSAATTKINTKIIAESYFLLNEVDVIPYARMGSELLAENVKNAVGKGNVFLMKNHGALAFGDTLLKAFDRMEVLEQAAKLSYFAGDIKEVTIIKPLDLIKIAAMR